MGDKDRIPLEGTPLHGANCHSLLSRWVISFQDTVDREEKGVLKERGLGLSWTLAAEDLELNLEDLAC